MLREALVIIVGVTENATKNAMKVDFSWSFQYLMNGHYFSSSLKVLYPTELKIRIEIELDILS